MLRRPDKFFATSTYVLVDFKEKIVGKYTAPQLAEFLNVNFNTLIPYIVKGQRYNVMYYIYEEQEYQQMLERRIQIPQDRDKNIYYY